MPHISNKVLTLPVIEENAPGLLQNAIEKRIARIRPMSTPIDQLSRCAGTRRVGSMKVEYYTIDSKPSEDVLKADLAVKEAAGEVLLSVPVTHDEYFEVSDTVLFPDNMGGDGNPLVGYVSQKINSRINVVIFNPVRNATGKYEAGPFTSGTKIIRMGRAAGELDVQTPQYAAIPVKDYNYCQIFKTQVEQSTLARLADKEVEWNLSDQEEAAVIDMRLGMEKNFLFGNRYLYETGTGDKVYLTGGIWTQTNRTHELELAELSSGALIDLCKSAFTGNNGSKRKIFICGTRLLSALSQLNFDKSVSAGETRVKWGIEFNEIRSNFGSLYVVHSEVFDQCGHASDGFILDPDYLTKYVHIPFSTEALDLRASGQRNTDAVVLTEASCLVLRHPDTHLRVRGV